LSRALREQRRRNRFGDDAACEVCGTTTLAHLTKVDWLTVCACCLALARGRELLEEHHVAGQGEGPTVRVCGNCHAELSDYQREWPDGLELPKRYAQGVIEFAKLGLRKRDERE
jgi:hypothetical protein